MSSETCSFKSHNHYHNKVLLGCWIYPEKKHLLKGLSLHKISFTALNFEDISQMGIWGRIIERDISEEIFWSIILTEYKMLTAFRSPRRSSQVPRPTLGSHFATSMKLPWWQSGNLTTEDQVCVFLPTNRIKSSVLFQIKIPKANNSTHARIENRKLSKPRKQYMKNTFPLSLSCGALTAPFNW